MKGEVTPYMRTSFYRRAMHLFFKREKGRTNEEKFMRSLMTISKDVPDEKILRWFNSDRQGRNAFQAMNPGKGGEIPNGD